MKPAAVSLLVLRTVLSLILVSGAAVLLLPRDVADAQAPGEALRVADLHLHPGPNFWPNTSPEELLRLLDRAGVQWAGNGTSGAPDDHWASLVQAAPGRFIPFAGQDIRTLILSQGEEAWSLRSSEITRYLERLEENLRARQFRGIGELFVNNTNSRLPNRPLIRNPADSPLMRRLLALVAKYQVPLSIHMDADPVSVEEFERLLTADRTATVIWAHCGGRLRGDAGIIRRMLGQHPNLLCELSQRDDRPLPNPEVRQRGMITDDARQLKADWKALLEDHSDRFLVGTDSAKPEHYQGIIDFFRAVLVQLTPDAARRLAHGNALRVFRLTQ